jgi:shikimate dehydrogenase
MSVTIPYKQAVSFLDKLSKKSSSYGAVNTIKITKGKNKGYNTVTTVSS